MHSLRLEADKSPGHGVLHKPLNSQFRIMVCRFSLDRKLQFKEFIMAASCVVPKKTIESDKCSKEKTKVISGEAFI